MVAYSFQPQFIEPILSGSKRQTIRAVGRRRHALPGEFVQLYRGLRTRYSEKIGESTCRDRSPIILEFGDRASVAVGIGIAGGPGRTYNGRSLDRFASLDGFADWPALVQFWNEHHGEATRFDGVLIEWWHDGARHSLGDMLGQDPRS